MCFEKFFPIIELHALSTLSHFPFRKTRDLINHSFRTGILFKHNFILRRLDFPEHGEFYKCKKNPL